MGDKIKSQADYEKMVVQASADYNRKDYEKALIGFLELEKSNFKNAKVHEVLCYLYLKLGKIPEAEKQFDLYESLLSGGKSTKARLKTFEETVAEAGDLSEREKEYEKLLVKTGSDNDLFGTAMQLSILYMSKGQFAKAEALMIDLKRRFT